MMVRKAGILALGLSGLLFCGCGTDIAAESPNRLYGAAGQSIVLEDIEEIVNDERLTDDQKRSALRDLGIEDEELIEALLTL